MQVLEGQIDGPFDLKYDNHLVVNGAISGPGRIGSGSTLTVNGAIGTGSVVVEMGGALEVNGSAGAMTIDIRQGGHVTIEGTFGAGEIRMQNGGALCVSGVYSGSFPVDGVVLVKPGTVLRDRYGMIQLQADGSLTSFESGGGVSIPPMSWDHALRFMRDGSFRPLAA